MFLRAPLKPSHTHTPFFFISELKTLQLE